MSELKYKVGDRVRIKSLDWYNENKEEDGNIRYKHGTAYPIFFTKYMSRFCGETLTIKCVHKESYYMNETGSCEFWTDEMIEGLVEEEVDLIPKFGEYSSNESLDVPTMTTEFIKEIGGLPCPEGYQFVDENGNVINATKIVLEKKKKEYPKTFEECCKILGLLNVDLCFNAEYRSFNASKEQWKRLGLMNQFYQLLICRDAYWKIAGEEMGLGKPWKPDWCDYTTKYCIYYSPQYRGFVKRQYDGIKHILAFPTEEMRDAFYENFKEEIESVKELL